MNLEFKTKEELYQRVYPALTAKRAELKRINNFSISEENIWNFLEYNIFSKKHGLTLADIVSEIMHTDAEILIEYLESK